MVRLARVLERILGLFFVFSAAAKALDLWGFAVQLHAYGIPQGLWTRLLVLGILGGETILGAALLTGVLVRGWTLRAAATMLAVFTGGIAYGWLVRDLDECGCLGTVFPMAPLPTIYKNGVLLGMVGLAMWGERRAHEPAGAIRAGASSDPGAAKRIRTPRIVVFVGSLGAVLAALVVGIALHSNAPRIACPDPVFDFGERSNTETVNHIFVLENDGKRDLEIGRIQTNCGCTVSRLGANTLAPGETTSLRATLDLRARTGRQKIHLSVESNDPARPVFQLTLTGEVRDDLRIHPWWINLGSIAPGTVAERSIDMVWNHESEFSVESASCAADFIDTELQVLEPGRKFRVVLRVTAPESGVRFASEVILRTSLPNLPEITVGVSGSTERVAYAPKIIAIRNRPGEFEDRQVHVWQGTAGVFEIVNIRVPDERIDVTVSALDSGGYRIRLDRVPQAEEMAGTEVCIETTLEEQPVIRIPFVLR